MGGQAHRVRWVSQYQSLAALEEALKTLLGDSRYLEMVGKGAELFIAGQTVDEIFTSV